MTQLSIRRKEDGKAWKVPEELNLLWDEERDEEPVSRDLFYIGLILDKYGLGIQGKVYDGGSYCFYLIEGFFIMGLVPCDEGATQDIKGNFPLDSPNAALDALLGEEKEG